MSGWTLHLAALAIGVVICALGFGLIWSVVNSGKYGFFTFLAVMGCAAGYCFGRAALLMLGWER
jgi:hypothetical protein